MSHNSKVPNFTKDQTHRHQSTGMNSLRNDHLSKFPESVLWLTLHSGSNSGFCSFNQGLPRQNM